MMDRTYTWGCKTDAADAAGLMASAEGLAHMGMVEHAARVAAEVVRTSRWPDVSLLLEVAAVLAWKVADAQGVAIEDLMWKLEDCISDLNVPELRRPLRVVR